MKILVLMSVLIGNSFAGTFSCTMNSYGEKLEHAYPISEDIVAETSGQAVLKYLDNIESNGAVKRDGLNVVVTDMADNSETKGQKVYATISDLACLEI